jgi:hypothetical protein
MRARSILKSPLEPLLSSDCCSFVHLGKSEVRGIEEFVKVWFGWVEETRREIRGEERNSWMGWSDWFGGRGIGRGMRGMLGLRGG